jgi:hypothetical protein
MLVPKILAGLSNRAKAIVLALLLLLAGTMLVWFLPSDEITAQSRIILSAFLALLISCSMVSHFSRTGSKILTDQSSHIISIAKQESESFSDDQESIASKDTSAQKVPESKDSKVSDESVFEELICRHCRKPIYPLRKGSLTAWIFRASGCSCKLRKSPEDMPYESSSQSTGKSAASLSPVSPVPVEIIAITAENWRLLFPENLELIEFIGSGGLACVMKAFDTSSNRHVAVKALNTTSFGDETFLMQFSNEIRLLQMLDHANVARVYGSGLTRDGRPYICMEFIDGESLADRYFGGPLSVKTSVDIFKQICSALEHIHSFGLMHRDIKPQNIIIENPSNTSTSSTTRAVLVDFGIACEIEHDGRDPALSQTGDLFGSPQYMSPEQCQSRQLSKLSDIYSLGCVIYESLAGRPPFLSRNPVKLMMHHIQKEPRQLNTFDNPEISTELNDIVMKCLQKEPSKRFSSAAELETALSRI